MPRFKIIITFKKTSNLLLECLRSLECQAYKDFEVALISENNINNYYSKIFKKIKIKKIYTIYKTPVEKHYYATIKNKYK